MCARDAPAGMAPDDPADDADLRDRVAQLEATVEKQQATIEQLLPSRRRVLQAGGLVAGGGVLGALTADRASADVVGQVGTSADRVDVFAGAVDANSVNTESASITNGLSAGSVETPSVATTSRNGIKGVDTSVPSGSATTIYQKANTTASAILIVTGSFGADSFADIVAYNSNATGEAVYQTDDGEIRASERSYSVANGYEVQLTQTTGGDLNTSVVSIGTL